MECYFILHTIYKVKILKMFIILCNHLAGKKVESPLTRLKKTWKMNGNITNKEICIKQNIMNRFFSPHLK